MKFKISAICLMLVLAGVTATQAHSPTIDADFNDWCFCEDGVDGVCPNPSIRPQDTSDVLTCNLGTEVAWFDGENDNLIINDFNVLATTFDDTALYFAATLYNDPDPASIPSAQVLIDVVPGGSTNWVDIEGSLAAPNVGLNATTITEADFNLVFDFANFLIGSPDSGELRVWDPDADPDTACQGTAVTPADCVRDGWLHLTFLQPAINPGQPGGAGGPPGGIELGVRWSQFECPSCPAIGPDDAFNFTFMVAQGDVALPLFTPGGLIEDNMSEEVAGTYTTTPDSCAIPGTECELRDSSSDAYVAGGPPSGDVDNLLLDGDGGGLIRMVWDASCLADNDDYAVYEGNIGDWTGQSSLVCTTGGDTNLAPAATGDNVYFLVVPRSGQNASASEGSYGTDSAGAERPAAIVPCGLQVAAECPAP